MSSLAIGGLGSPALAADDQGAAGPFLPGPPLVYGEAPSQSVERSVDVRITRAEASASIVPAAVDYYMRTYGTTEREARYRLATQGMVPDIGAVLDHLLGEGFTDVKWDAETGQLVVMATDAVSDAEIERALRERNLTDADFRIEHVDYDRDSLLETGKALTDELAPLTRNGLATVGIGGGTVEVTLAASTTGLQRSSVAAITSRATDDDAPPVNVTLSRERRVQGAPDTWCQLDSGWRFCDEIIAGGSYYRVTSTGGWHGCTWAFFVGWTGRNPFVPSVLTAGHCLNSYPLVTPQHTCRPGIVNCGQVGLSLQYYYGYGRSDVGMIDLYAQGWQIYAGWFNHGPVSYTPLGSYLTSSPGRDTVVCKNGLATGSSCGSVSLSTVAPDYGGGIVLQNMIEITGMRTCHGDSGSPVTLAAQAYAVGIHSGSQKNESADCGNVAAWVSPLWEADYYLDLDIYSGGGPYGPYA